MGHGGARAVQSGQTGGSALFNRPEERNTWEKQPPGHGGTAAGPAAGVRREGPGRVHPEGSGPGIGYRDGGSGSTAGHSSEPSPAGPCGAHGGINHPALREDKQVFKSSSIVLRTHGVSPNAGWRVLKAQRSAYLSAYKRCHKDTLIPALISAHCPHLPARPGSRRQLISAWGT